MVALRDSSGSEFARGLTNYSADDIRRIRGLKTGEIQEVLEHCPYDEVIHRDNMVVTTSGNYLPAAFKCTREALGMDKMMLGTDHPYEDMGECMAFLEGLDLSEKEKGQLYEGNAVNLDGATHVA